MAGRSIVHSVSSEGAVCAVIVSYRPAMANIAASVRCLRSRGIGVAVVDNGSDPVTVQALHALATESGAILTALDANVGIAAAQNIGIGQAIAAGFQFVLLLDHDSLPADDMVEQLLRAHRQLADSGLRVAAVGPVTVDTRTGARSAFVRFDGIRIRRHVCDASTPTVEADFLIASGMLIPIDVLQTVGTMNEELFIDHVDTEWCLRARKAGYAIFGACDAQLHHTLGEHIVRLWLGRWREVAVHAPTRHYYVFRNTILMLRRTPMPVTWRVAQVLRLLQLFLFYALLGASRAQRLGYMLKGIADGLRNRSGPLCV